MKSFVLYLTLTGMLILTSCEKHTRLIEESKKIDAETKQSYQELAAIDARILSHGGDVDVGIISAERQNAEWLRKNTALEAELADLSKRCADGEAAIKELRPKVDAYKAKYLR